VLGIVVIPCQAKRGVDPIGRSQRRLARQGFELAAVRVNQPVDRVADSLEQFFTAVMAKCKCNRAEK